MNIDISFLGDGLFEVWEALIALPANVWQPALLVFIFVSLLKKAKLVGKDKQAQAANLILSFLFAKQNPEQMAGIALLGAAFYKFWDRWISPAIQSLRSKAKKASPA